MIYLLRHGLDDESYIGGWSNVDLISEGIIQVKKTREFIVDNKLLINKIISSDIKRAQTTANIINEKLNVELILDKDLRELDKGILTGVKKSDLSDNDLKKIKEFNIYDKYLNGESMLDLYKRMKYYLKYIKKYDNLLLVTHRGVINMFYYILNDIKLDMDKEKFHVSHASLHEMNINKKIIRRIY